MLDWRSGSLEMSNRQLASAIVVLPGMITNTSFRRAVQRLTSSSVTMLMELPCHDNTWVGISMARTCLVNAPMEMRDAGLGDRVDTFEVHAAEDFQWTTTGECYGGQINSSLGK